MLKKIILSLFFVLICSASAFEADSVGIVTYIVDGDTIDVLATSGFMNGSEYRIRFADINAPELDIEEGQEAKEALKSLLYGKMVCIDIDNITTYDSYGRVVAVVYLPVNKTHAINVNYNMVLNNHSVIWDFSNEFDPNTWTPYEELPWYYNTPLKYTFSKTPLFEDNFDYFDTTKWYNYDGGSHGAVVTIGYSRVDKNCLSFENGTGIIKIQYNASDDKFHSYYMETYQEMGYGIYEAKRKFTKSINTNFAFWLYSPKDKYRDYKDNSEIDWESGYNNGMAYSSTNYWYSDIFNGSPWSGFLLCHNENELNISRLDWHVYKIEYTPTYIKWYIDDKLVRTAPGNMTVVAHDTEISESPENLTESDTLRIFFDCAILMSYNSSIDGDTYMDHLYVDPVLKSENYIGYHYIDWVRYYPLEGYNNIYYIDHLPYDIRKPGTYILTKNFTYENNETPIEIYVNDVIIDGNGNTLEGNILSSAIYSNTQRNITIKNINLKNWDKGIELRYINNTKLENISVESSNYGVFLWELSNAKVDGINSSNCSSGMYIIYSGNVSLTNISSKNNLAGVKILNSANISVESFIENGDENGIVILNGKDIVISNSEGLDSSKIYNIMSSTHITLNNISGKNSISGIYMDKTSKSSIFGFTGKNTYDVSMKHSNNLNLSNSTLSGDYNIILSSSQNITVINSYLAQNSTNWGCGIKLIDSSSSVFTKNTVVGKPSIFYISEDSTNNYIYLNNFIDNKYKYCKNPNNSFKSQDNITYIFNNTVFNDYLGNYWSNYNGIDFNGNGIGDTPYTIDSSASDFSPLVESYEYYKNR